MIHPAHRLIQLGLDSSGYSPGKIDSWFGDLTGKAGLAMLASGPARGTSAWAIATLRRGLAELGYLEPGGSTWDKAAQDALRLMIAADGLPLAEAADPTVILEPVKPDLRPVAHGRVIRQGSAGYVVDTIVLHCGALPGNWHIGKTNRQMLNGIRQMHTAPVSQGGRGWSDIGYSEVTFPDGEILVGRGIEKIGAGAIGHNRGVYHLLMIEIRTIDRTRRPEDYFRPETLAAAKRRIEEVSSATPIKRLMGHREVAAKLCPGFEVIDREWTDRAVA